MKKFLVTADSSICRDGQYVNFKELHLRGESIPEPSSDGPEWYDFHGEFVLDTCVEANTIDEALTISSKDYQIDTTYLKAYELN